MRRFWKNGGRHHSAVPRYETDVMARLELIDPEIPPKICVQHQLNDTQHMHDPHLLQNGVGRAGSVGPVSQNHPHAREVPWSELVCLSACILNLSQLMLR
jgi:hypothetical protein